MVFSEYPIFVVINESDKLEISLHEFSPGNRMIKRQADKGEVFLNMANI